MKAERPADSTGNGDHPSAGSGSEWERFILSGDFAEAEEPENQRHIETAIEWYHLFAGGAAAVQPAQMMPCFTGPDTFLGVIELNFGKTSVSVPSS